MSVTTKTGDKGETSLYTGERVKKSSLRVETYGTIDEICSALAMARAAATKPEVRDSILSLQKKLSLLMADFASLGREPIITAETVQEIEAAITATEEKLPPLNGFIVPGDTQAGAALDLARTVTRRAERLALRLAAEEDVAPSDLIYLNRVSDYVFLLMRLEEL